MRKNKDLNLNYISAKQFKKKRLSQILEESVAVNNLPPEVKRTLQQTISSRMSKGLASNSIGSSLKTKSQGSRS